MEAERFGSFVAQRRRERGMTQATLASELHMTDKAISRWERGVGFPDIGNIEPLADALGVSIVELMRAERTKEQTMTTNETEDACGSHPRRPSRMVGRRLAYRDTPQLASTSLDPRAPCL